MSKKIIIIDDSIFFIKKLTSFLEETMGYQVIATGHNGYEAVKLYDKYKPDLMTLDITMPIKGGVEALTEILADFPAAKIMMISAVSGPEMTLCLKLGAVNYTEKPLDFNDTAFVQDFKTTLSGIFQ